MKYYLDKIGLFCENATSELADVLVDVTEKRIYKKILR